MESNDNRRGLLIIDGASQHPEEETKLLLDKHNIDILWLPPKSSHATQPLDNGIFNIYSRYYESSYSRAMKFLAYSNDVTPAEMKRARMTLASLIATEKCCLKSNIKQAWLNTAIYPYDFDGIANNPLVPYQDVGRTKRAADRKSDRQIQSKRRKVAVAGCGISVHDAFVFANEHGLLN